MKKSGKRENEKKREGKIKISTQSKIIKELNNLTENLNFSTKKLIIQKLNILSENLNFSTKN
jgi:hypothetical protein